MSAREGLIVIAGEQTAGRGRLTRSWRSPPGGLYLSLLLRPHIPLIQASQLTMLVSLAAITACQNIAGVTPRPKWPNDLLLAGKKLAGVLTEIEYSDQWLRHAIIGMGLNVNTRFDEPPLAAIATSLQIATGASHDLDALADAFIRALSDRYDAFLAGASPHQDWARQLEPLGKRVEVQQPGQSLLQGLAEEVTPEGALRIRDDAGKMHVIWAGDVKPIA